MGADASEPAESGENEPLAARLRDLLRRHNPIYLGPLGLLSLPADWHERLAFLDLFGIFYLFFLWILVGPVVDLALRSRLEDPSEPTDWITAGDRRELAVALGTMPLAFLNPLLLLQDLTQLAGSWVRGLIRYRGSLPDAGSYEQTVAYRLPFEGTWTAFNGSPEREYSHSWIYPSQRYAYDFVITDDDGNTRPEDASATVEEYYCYAEPVLAPADGVVVEAFDAALESRRAGGFSHPASRDIRGGYVVIKHADAEFSLLAHLKPGSVPVAVGETIRRGQEVGRCGHSGNSSEPHLHFQVQDHPSFELAVTLPVEFDAVRIESPGVSHDEDLVADAEMGEGVHEKTYVVAGQRVEHAGEQYGEGTERTAEPVRTGSSPGETGPGSARFVKQAAFGLGVGGLLLSVGRLLVQDWQLVVVLAGAGAIGVLYGVAYRRRHGGEFATRSPGRPVGLLLAAGLFALLGSTGTGSGVAGGLLFVSGVLGYGLLGEYQRWTLPEIRPSSASS